jgi:hypothetical protein
VPKFLHPDLRRAADFTIAEQHDNRDYVPSHDVLPIIQHYLKIGTDPCLAGVIDYLIRSGHQAITGKGG